MPVPLLLGHDFILALFLFVPSMDEIQQRRSEVNNLKQYSLDISNVRDNMRQSHEKTVWIWKKWRLLCD
jgi:hypothetical protein